MHSQMLCFRSLLSGKVHRQQFPAVQPGFLITLHTQITTNRPNLGTPMQLLCTFSFYLSGVFPHNPKTLQRFCNPVLPICQLCFLHQRRQSLFRIQHRTLFNQFCILFLHAANHHQSFHLPFDILQLFIALIGFYQTGICLQHLILSIKLQCFKAPGIGLQTFY